MAFSGSLAFLLVLGRMLALLEVLGDHMGSQRPEYTPLISLSLRRVLIS